MGAHVGSTLHRSKSDLHIYTIRLRYVSNTYRTRFEFRHASRLSFPNWFIWLTSASYGRREYRRHVHTSKASVWAQYLGHLCRVWPRTRPFNWRIYRYCGGLDLDHMGAHVAVGVLPGFLVLFSARNELDKYLISTNAPLEGGYWRHQVYL